MEKRKLSTNHGTKRNGVRLPDGEIGEVVNANDEYRMNKEDEVKYQLEKL